MIGACAAIVVEQLRELREHHAVVARRYRKAHELEAEELAESAEALERVLQRADRASADLRPSRTSLVDATAADSAQRTDQPSAGSASASMSDNDMHELEELLRRIRATDAEIVALHQRMDEIAVSVQESSADLLPSGPLGEQRESEVARDLRIHRRRAFVASFCDLILPLVPILLTLTLALLFLRSVRTESAPGSSSPSSTEQTDGR